MVAVGIPIAEVASLAACRSKFAESLGKVGVEALAGRNRQIPAEASTPACLSDRLLGTVYRCGNGVEL
jgi:hypothetical protein